MSEQAPISAADVLNQATAGSAAFEAARQLAITNAQIATETAKQYDRAKAWVGDAEVEHVNAGLEKLWTMQGEREMRQPSGDHLDGPAVLSFAESVAQTVASDPHVFLNERQSVQAGLDPTKHEANMRKLRRAVEAARNDQHDTTSLELELQKETENWYTAHIQRAEASTDTKADVGSNKPVSVSANHESIATEISDNSSSTTRRHNRRVTRPATTLPSRESNLDRPASTSAESGDERSESTPPAYRDNASAQAIETSTQLETPSALGTDVEDFVLAHLAKVQPGQVIRTKALHNDLEDMFRAKINLGDLVNFLDSQENTGHLVSSRGGNGMHDDNTTPKRYVVPMQGDKHEVPQLAQPTAGPADIDVSRLQAIKPVSDSSNAAAAGETEPTEEPASGSNGTEAEPAANEVLTAEEKYIIDASILRILKQLKPGVIGDVEALNELFTNDGINVTADQLEVIFQQHEAAGNLALTYEMRGDGADAKRVLTGYGIPAENSTTGSHEQTTTAEAVDPEFLSDMMDDIRFALENLGPGVPYDLLPEREALTMMYGAPTAEAYLTEIKQSFRSYVGPTSEEVFLNGDESLTSHTHLEDEAGESKDPITDNFEVSTVEATEVRSGKSVNEDTVLIDHDMGLMAVFDGMGGHSSGEAASKAAAKAVKDYIASLPMPTSSAMANQQMAEAFYTARDEVNAAGDDRGTTASVVRLLNIDGKQYASIGGAGDSRIILYRDGKLMNLTPDQSVKNVLYNSIGGGQSSFDDTFQTIRLRAGDQILIASDGITGDRTEEKLSNSEYIDAFEAANETGTVDAFFKASRKVDDKSAIMLFVDTQETNTNSDNEPLSSEEIQEVIDTNGNGSDRFDWPSDLGDEEIAGIKAAIKQQALSQLSPSVIKKAARKAMNHKHSSVESIMKQSELDGDQAETVFRWMQANDLVALQRTPKEGYKILKDAKTAFGIRTKIADAKTARSQNVTSTVVTNPASATIVTLPKIKGELKQVINPTTVYRDRNKSLLQRFRDAGFYGVDNHPSKKDLDDTREKYQKYSQEYIEEEGLVGAAARRALRKEMRDFDRDEHRERMGGSLTQRARQFGNPGSDTLLYGARTIADNLAYQEEAIQIRAEWESKGLTGRKLNRKVADVMRTWRFDPNRINIENVSQYGPPIGAYRIIDSPSSGLPVAELSGKNISIHASAKHEDVNKGAKKLALKQSANYETLAYEDLAGEPIQLERMQKLKGVASRLGNAAVSERAQKAAWYGRPLIKSLGQKALAANKSRRQKNDDKHGTTNHQPISLFPNDSHRPSTPPNSGSTL